MSVPFRGAGVDRNSTTFRVSAIVDVSIGEESYASGVRAELTDDPTFCVDPIGMLGDDISRSHGNSDVELLP